MTILVTGATGALGRLVVDGLLDRGAAPTDIIAGARDTAKAADLTDRGVRVVRLDYDDPATVRAAVEGVDAVLLISSSEVGHRIAQHRSVIDAARNAGVSKFVYTSAPRATTTDLVLAPEHKATEEAIVASGLPSVILRNNWYTENYASDLEAARATGVLAASTGAGRVASASRRDFADAAAVVLLDDGHLGSVYELGGDTAWDYTELAAAMTEVTRRTVEFRDVSLDDRVTGLKAAGLDPGTAGFVAAIDTGIRNGALAGTDGSLSRLIGRPTTPLVDGLRALV
ncbi:SDR family oxidoreductase [Tsukamurella pseudospumae]|uniref:NAD(P)-dependent oxidoreductase n=1 Tax=Tsukamurella pseudospumae TaxID=239498 RepID=A0A138ANT1_9ACTN|nr:SDR family oxidoreductase [Tsukamurella pseudospumae]KXP12104.1 NAD(P)-dependent oxidoreductase [Tsukamurella pseudospumae]